MSDNDELPSWIEIVKLHNEAYGITLRHERLYALCGRVPTLEEAQRRAGFIVRTIRAIQNHENKKSN